MGWVHDGEISCLYMRGINICGENILNIYIGKVYYYMK